MKQSTRSKMLTLRLTDQEKKLIAEKMKIAGIPKMSTYLRKMAIDGYILKLDMPELKEMISLMRYSSNNLNQIAKRTNETGRTYEADIQSIQDSQEKIWTGINKILRKLGEIT